MDAFVPVASSWVQDCSVFVSNQRSSSCFPQVSIIHCQHNCLTYLQCKTEVWLFSNKNCKFWCFSLAEVDFKCTTDFRRYYIHNILMRTILSSSFNIIPYVQLCCYLPCFKSLLCHLQDIFKSFGFMLSFRIAACRLESTSSLNNKSHKRDISDGTSNMQFENQQRQ